MRLPSLCSLAFIATGFMTAAAGSSSAETPGLPDLSLQVLPKSDSCASATLCSVAIHIMNAGNAPYDGYISVSLDLHAPAVAAPMRAGSAPCTREDYGKFRCDLPKTKLAPGDYVVIEPEFLFTATAYQSSNACASLRWAARTLLTRDAMLEDAIAASGHRSTELASAAGLGSGEQDRSKLLAALAGRWGEGDAFAANDSSCAAFGIVRHTEEPSCASGEVWRSGACIALARWCPSNREHPEGADRCSCPAALPDWNFEASRCEAQSAHLACPASGADASNFCRCPPDRPVFNAALKACATIGTTQASANSADVQSPELPKPAAKPPITAETKRAPPHSAATASFHSRAPKTATRAIQSRRTAALDRKPAVRQRSTLARAEVQRRCRAFQRWGPTLKRCVPWPIRLMGRIFAPAEGS